MTPATLAALHRAAFDRDRPWSADEFADLIKGPYVDIFVQPHGFALTRTLAGESELLTIAVDPTHQRRGIGSELMSAWLAFARARAETAFLDVAADNRPAIALYEGSGFETVAVRRGYYARSGTAAVDALIMRCTLTLGQAPDSAAVSPESS